MRIFAVITLMLVAGFPLWASDSTTTKKSGTPPAPAKQASIQTEKSPEGQNSKGGSLPPMTKTYPPRQESWNLPVELDPKIKIKKIYDFLNDPAVTKAGKDQVAAREFDYYNHGAVTEAQIESRKGHYYTVSWENGGDASDLILRMDYRQRLSGDKVSTLEIPYKDIKGGVKGRFSITGDTYKNDGDVNSWRISIVRNGKIIAQSFSFVW